MLHLNLIIYLAPVSVPHATLEDSYICGKFVPKQSIILCDLMSVHMDPTVSDEPDVFRPERFIDENGQFRKNEAFCSFSMGKHILQKKRKIKNYNKDMFKIKKMN